MLDADVAMGVFAPLRVVLSPSRVWLCSVPAKTQKTDNSNLHGFELHRPSSTGTKLLLRVIKAIINQFPSPVLGSLSPLVFARGGRLYPSFSDGRDPLHLFWMM